MYHLLRDPLERTNLAHADHQRTREQERELRRLERKLRRVQRTRLRPGRYGPGDQQGGSP
jgi:hypothetical protein